jgi:hypothetical protein
MKVNRFLRPLAGILASLAFGGAAAAAQAPPPTEHFGDRRIVLLRTDAEAEEAVLQRLAALRRSGDRAAFTRVLDARRAELLGRQGTLAQVVEDTGGTVLGGIWLIDAILVGGSSEDLDARLWAHPLVERVERDRALRPEMGQAIDAQHHDAVGAHALDAGGLKLQGGGLPIAIIDSGIDADMGGLGRPHAAFFPEGDPTQPTGGGIGGSRILSMVDLELADGSADAEDTYGHGTRMASVLGGADFSTLPDIADGIAPEAVLRVWKISDDGLAGGLASTAMMIKALNEVAADPDVRVANMSYGGSPTYSFAPNHALDNAVLAGVFVAVAGGNLGADLSTAHASHNVLPSGASEEAQKKPASFPGFFMSAIGPLPDGRRYPQLLAVGDSLTCAAMDTESVAGATCCTSAASAMIAGGGLLVTQADPSLSPLAIKALLLNESLPVTLGNPAAAGYGYLHVKRSVDAALAGRVISETIGTGQAKRFQVALAAGESRAFTAVWHRKSAASGVANLDLELRDPGGALVATAASSVDSVEQIRFTAASTGVHEVVVTPAGAAHLPATFALAGTSEHSVDDGLGCPGGPPAVQSVSPTQVPSLAPGPNQVVLQGCGMLGVASVQLGGVEADGFLVSDDTMLTVNLPKAPALGTLPLTVTNASGSTSVPLQVVAPPPTLALHNQAFFSAEKASFSLGSAPSDLLVLLASLQGSPTVVPGVVSLDVGASATSLFPLATVAVPASGWLDLEFPFQLAGIPPFTTFYFQAVAVASPPALPLATTNVVSAPFVF